MRTAGSYADCTASKKEWLAKVSDRFPIEIGGGVPLVSLTAIQVGQMRSCQQLPAAITSEKVAQTRLAQVVRRCMHCYDIRISGLSQPRGAEVSHHACKVPIGSTQDSTPQHEVLSDSGTALQALQSGGVPKPGARVLIQGGSGGVGHFAIQLAKVHFKAYVVATGGPSNQAFMKVQCTAAALGAHSCDRAERLQH